MCRAISFFSKSNDAQFESGAIQDTRILTGSAFDAPCVRSEIAATSAINQDRTSHICPSHAGSAGNLRQRLLRISRNRDHSDRVFGEVSLCVNGHEELQ